MSGQNTQKQILAMVLLMFMGVISLGAYVWFDDGRRAEAEDGQRIEGSERGARLFANNCRVCHGNAGEGFIGVALNTPENTLPFRSGNSGALAELQARLRGAIECGRNGTLMPPWAEEHGGSLNFFHIDNLVTLITTNANNAWEEALHLAEEQDAFTLVGLEDALIAAQRRATAVGVTDAVTASLAAAGGDAVAALREAVLLRSRGDIAAQVDEELGTALNQAEVLESEKRVAEVEARMAARETELINAAVDEALTVGGGSARLALNTIHQTLADIAVQDAQTTRDDAIARVEAGRPLQLPPSGQPPTSGTCGQRAAASARGDTSVGEARAVAAPHGLVARGS